MMSEREIVWAIDPGHEEGAIARWDSTDPTGGHACTTSQLMAAHGNYLGLAVATGWPTMIAIEAIPLVSTPQSAKLFIAYGRAIEFATSVQNCRVVGIPPQQWQRYYEFPSGLTYAQRKAHAHRLLVTQVMAGVTVTRPVVDVLLILHYVLNAQPKHLKPLSI